MRFPEKFIESSQIGAKLQGYFDKTTIEELARANKFVQRISPLTGTKFAKLCICGLLDQGMMTTLTGLCTIALELNLKIRPQGLDSRFNSKAVAFMKALFDKAIALRFANSKI